MLTTDTRSMPENIQKNIPLAEFTWWKVGGAAEYYAQPTSIEELQQVHQWAQKESLPITVLSGGSNVLVSDKGVPGLVIHMTKLSAVESVEVSDGRLKIQCLAGADKSVLLREFSQRALMPAVFLSGLPGGVAGGVVMNAGVGFAATPKEFCEITDWVEVLRPSGELERVQELEWDYRHCQGWQPGIITRAQLSWPDEKSESMRSELKASIRRRVSSQPLQFPSGGSTFRNPEGDKAGRLIEQAGLKGYQLGGAQVSEKHANFIVNTGNATATEIQQLIRHIQKVVQEKFAIKLATEIVLLGPAV